MKKSISLILAVIMLFSVVSVGVSAVSVATPKATASNAVGGINVYWNAVEDAVKYNVYRRAGGSSSWVYAGTTQNTNLLDKGVTNGKYYAYSVRAYNAQGNYSAYNKNMTYNVKCVATPKLTTLVNTTSGLKLTWGAVSGASYRVYRRGVGSTTWTYLGATNGTAFTDSKATSGQYWRYTVRAVSSGYYSGFDTNGVYTMRLANPYSVKATQKVGYVSVSWAKMNGATGYRVYKRGAGATYWTYLGTSTTTSFIDSTVVNGQYYRYAVRATRGNIMSDFYSNNPAIKYTSHTPVKDYKVFPKLWENFRAFGYMCGESIRNTNGEFDTYIPPRSDYILVKVDCCKNYADYIEHIKFYVDTTKVDVSDYLVPQRCTFVHKGCFYILFLGAKGISEYELLSSRTLSNGDIYLECEAFPPGEMVNFTLRNINGTLKIVEANDY